MKPETWTNVHGEALSRSLSLPVCALWEMCNGYALCSAAGLDAISAHIGTLQQDQLDDLRGKLRIGLHSDVAVTDAERDPLPLVSQAFCSALPVAYTTVPPALWKPFASLVLEAAYEATMLAAILNKKRGATNFVLVTLLGEGAFGNDVAWIRAAIRRAFKMMSGFELDARIVSYGDPPPEIEQIAREFG